MHFLHLGYGTKAKAASLEAETPRTLYELDSSWVGSVETSVLVALSMLRWKLAPDRNDATRFTCADVEVRGENGQRRFKKDFGQLSLSIEDPMEPDCTKCSVSSTGAFVNKMFALCALVILSPSASRAVNCRLVFWCLRHSFALPMQYGKPPDRT